MSLLITGYKGVVGSAVFKFFSDQGYEPLPLDYDWATGSYLIQPEVLAQRRAVILHLGAESNRRANAELCIRRNVVPCHALRSLLLEHDSLNLVFFSAASIFRRSPASPYDWRAFGCLEPYELSKLFGEHVFNTAGIASRCAILRVPAVYGVGQNSGLIARFAVEAIKRGQLSVSTPRKVINSGVSIFDLNLFLKCLVDDVLSCNAGFSAPMNLGFYPSETVLSVANEVAKHFSASVVFSDEVLDVGAEAGALSLDEARSRGFSPGSCKELIHLAIKDVAPKSRALG